MSTYEDTLKTYSLKVLVLECPYDTFTTSEFTREFLMEIFKLKLEGYGAKYPYGVMPVSEYDLMGTHICIAQFDGRTYTPISAFKSITARTCKTFRTDFPVIGSLFGNERANYASYVSALTKWQDELDARETDYAYNASWTMKTDLPIELRDVVRELAYGLFYLYYKTKKLDFVINATSAKFHVNKHQEVMGLKYLSGLDGNPLPALISPVFFKESYFLMYVDSGFYSDVFQQKCRPFEALWEDRLIVNKHRPLQVKKTA